jgi:hypothetical protein
LKINIAPSDLYSEILQPLENSKGQSFDYIGRVKPPMGPSKKFDFDPLVNSIMLPFLKSEYPDLLDGNKLKTKYTLSRKYARAEYVSISKYSSDWKMPIFSAFESAKQVCAEAFACMDNSPLLDIDSSIRWLDRQSSPGYPWSLIYQKKAPIIDSDWWASWYCTWEDSVLAGAAKPFYWRAFIKDEVKKQIDIDAHNPRSILASPMQATVLGYRLFGPMNEKLTAAGTSFRTPCFVGVPKFGRMWHRLALHLLHFPNRAHGDATRWDGSLMPPSLEFMCKFRQACCSTDSMKAAFEYFYSNVINSHIVGWNGDLFVKKVGQPSGQVNTLHDNTIIHALYFFYHWVLVVCRDPRFEPTWASFKSHVHLVVMGDDCIWSWSNETANVMKASCVAETFKSIGVLLKYNDDNTDTPQTIDTLEFCSMHFHPIVCDSVIVYVPLMKREKMIASMFLKKQEVNPRVLLRRLLSIRIEVWYDTYLRNMCDKAVEYLLENYSIEMGGKPTLQGGDDASLELILTLRWPRYVIERHYLDPIV